MYCSNCGSKTEENGKFCAACGQNLKSKNPKNTWLIVGVCISLITTVGVCIGIFILLSNNNDKATQISTQPETPKIEQVTNVPAEKEMTEKEKTQVIKESMPKVFTIISQDSQGSGFLYQQGGYIVTNAHVVAGNTDVIVRNHAGQESPAQVIGISDRSDVALLLAKDYVNAQPFEIEKEKSVVGTEVIAIGSPQGFENSASIGYLTGTNRNMEYGFVYEELYQIDAQISQGSSGGPLVDGKTGKVIGINSLLYTPNNSFGFSIPLYTVTSLVDGWIHEPMSKNAVASLFGVYEEFTYSDPAQDYYYEEEYADYWDEYGTEEYYDEEYYNDYWDEYSYSFDEESLTNFILSFREYYELALYYEEFYWISDMLDPNGTAYTEMEEYINDIAAQNFTFDFLNNSVTNIEMYGDYAVVSTNEQFNFYNGTGEEKYYDRYKEYTVLINEEGYYQISEIYIYE
ncbi:trypsin-like peptidase domain-containing protein [Lysinibacillus sp. BW-2-10]|uniref:trypsin-like peptidase domain-containing protein n=1 Tax=Lysinibacillus sp. BW-2-10 TaxID=2590030 RepID=UPI0011804EC8|nr:trypsin-like peptidase domain-containing protein [Lysinibacillus sp. BW-2-10]TSI10668.1 trypsin-like serine protease [Lysinibacillus sp. BW-2-10]